MNEPRVIKHNAIIEASYSLSLSEQRILLACIAQVRRDKPITDDMLYRVSTSDIEKLAGIKRQVAWRSLKKAEESLWHRDIYIPYVKDDGETVERKFRWIQEVRYCPNKSYIEIRFSKAVLPYLTELTERFTSYHLTDIAQMTSQYAIRLYELLVQWRTTGYRELSVDWLRNAFQLKDQYKRMRDFKRHVIDNAVEQINTYSPLQLSYETVKKGREVTHFRFFFQSKPELESPPDDKKPSKPKAYTRQDIDRNPSLAKPGESYEQALARLNASM